MEPPSTDDTEAPVEPPSTDDEDSEGEDAAFEPPKKPKKAKKSDADPAGTTGGDTDYKNLGVSWNEKENTERERGRRLLQCVRLEMLINKLMLLSSTRTSST